MKLKRYDIKTLLQNPKFRRKMVCEGTVTVMAREGVDVDISEVYDMYDKFTSKGLKMPDGYQYEKKK